MTKQKLILFSGPILEKGKFPPKYMYIDCYLFFRPVLKGRDGGISEGEFIFEQTERGLEAKSTGSKYKKYIKNLCKNYV